MTSELDFSQFFCCNKDYTDYGIKNQGNIVLEESMVKTIMLYLNVEPVNVVLVKPEVQYFSNLIFLMKKS